MIDLSLYTYLAINFDMDGCLSVVRYIHFEI